MPLQNRVDPFGRIIRTSARGTFLGNRGGAIHNDRREIVRPFKSRRWITCVLSFRNRHREVMTPGRYTELFFLDEAVAFSAGHRPCAECRRERFLAFRAAWSGAGLSPRGASAPPSADEMDEVLHPLRVGPDRGWQSPLGSLPGGTFVQIDNSACLVWDGALLLWTPEGYSRREESPPLATLSVLTPKPIVECFRNGYVPKIHASANTFGRRA
jgi:hypothetical protein